MRVLVGMMKDGGPIREMAVAFSMKIHFSKSLKRRTQSSQRKPVRCIETGLIYASSSDASDMLSPEVRRRATVGICCNRSDTHKCDANRIR